MATARTRQDRDKPTVIKKYANRRLYDTGRSSYVTLDDLCIMVKEGRDFVVYDAKTGEDLTRSVLTQIIVEQEGKEGQNMLPTSFLRQLIGFYGDSLQSLIPNYLDQTIQAFSSNQDEFRRQYGQSAPNMMNPVTVMEEITRKNMEIFETAMRAWSPFAAAMTARPGNPSEHRSESRSDNRATAQEDATDNIETLRRNIAEMEEKITRLSKEKR